MNKISRTVFEFTLIELLIVIAIIAILISILLPSLLRVKELVKLTVCSNNLKQIGIAATNYATDYNYIPPPLGYDPTNTGIWYAPYEKRWTGLINEYLNSRGGTNWKLPEAVRCPIATASSENIYWYGMNYQVSGFPFRSRKPERTVWIGDTGAHWGEGSSFYLFPNRWRQIYIYRHISKVFKGRLNTVCLDGHIEGFNFITDDGIKISRPHDACRWFVP